MGLRSFVQSLIRARKNSKALQAGALKFLGHRGDALAFARTYTHADGRVESALIGVNRDVGEALNFNTALVGVFEGSWQDAVTGEVFHARDGILKITVFRPRVLLPML
jgi:alpha-glucosidase